MRLVSSQSPSWQSPGIGSTDIATLFNCAVEGQTPLTLWAAKMEQRAKWLLKEEKRMKKIAEKDLPQGSPEWLAWRQGGVGGSEVSTVMGLNPWEKLEDLWKLKVGEIGGKAENENMRRGKELEPEVRRIYQEWMGWNSPPLCILHDRHDFMRCSLDGLRDDEKVVLEVKCPGEKSQLKVATVLESADPQQAFAQLIPYYYCQVQYQLFLSGAPLCHFVSYCKMPRIPPHQQFLLVPIREDKPRQEQIERRVKWFWDYVIRGVPPTDTRPPD